jgi:uncharacterized protein YjbI with pentapeptide repeats
MEGAELAGARLEGTSLLKASLIGAQLQGTALDSAQLQGATLDQAQLQAASLDQAQLQGASLFRAQLQGASLAGAQLQGASLDSALLPGASLNFAQLQGAWLDGAQLQGASFNLAQLQGASLAGAQIQGASLDGTFVFRTSTSNLVLGPVIGTVNTRSEFLSAATNKTETLTDPTIDLLITDATLFVVSTDRRELIEWGLARLKTNGVVPDEDAKISAFWADLNKKFEKSFDATAYNKVIADLTCTDAKSEEFNPIGIRLAPYVARRLMHNGILEATKDALPAIAASMRSGRKNIENCPGVEGFTDEDWADLDKLSPPK